MTVINSRRFFIMASICSVLQPGLVFASQKNAAIEIVDQAVSQINQIINSGYTLEEEYLNLFIELFFYKNINTSKKISFKIKKYFYLKLSFVKKYNLDFESFFLEFNDKLLSE